MEWKEYKLGDICTIVGRIGYRGYTTDDLTNSPNDGAITLSPTNIVAGELDLSKPTYIKWSKYYESPEIMLKQGDIVLVKTASIGLTTRIREVKHPMTINPQFVILKDIKVDNVFLSYVIKSPYFQALLRAIAVGSTIPTLTQENLAKLTVQIPDISTQKEIASILSSLDDKIELNRQINQNLEALAKQLYDYWFVQFDFPNEEGKPYKSSGGKMVWNEKLKRDIPNGWQVLSLETLGSFKNGINYSKDEVGNFNYRIVNVRNISSSSLFIDTEDLDNICLKSESADNYLVGERDILIARSSTPGATRITQKDAEAIIYCGFIICFSVNELMLKPLITYQLKSLESVTRDQSNGSVLSNISQDVLKKLYAVVPSAEVLKQFNRQISSIWHKLDKTLVETSNLVKQRDELLPLLMNGQIAIE